jgi:hypothetical protein
MLETTTELLDAGGNVLANGYNSDRAQIIDRIAVPRGTYYVKFTQIAGAGDYSFRIVADYGGETTATARDLGNLAGTSRQMFDMVARIESGVASYNDSVDLYRFTFAETAPLDIGLNIPAAFDAPTFDANLRLARDMDGNGFISAGETLIASADAGSDRISTTLTPGIYFVVVDQSRNYPSYQLDVDSDFDAVPTAPQPWLNMSQARAAGELGGETFFTDGFGISAGDFRDSFRFQMEAPGTLSASAQINPFYSRTTQPPVLYVIRDDNQNLLHDPGEELNPNGDDGFLNMQLPAGSYFLAAVGVGQQADYQLRLVPDYAGNTLTDARPLADLDFPVLSQTQTFRDYIEQSFGATSDVDDFYRFSLSGDARATLSTDGLPGEDLSLALIHDANRNGQVDAGELLQVSDNPDSPAESLDQVLNAGTYFVRVSGVNGSTNYTLSAEFEALSGAPEGDFNGNGRVEQADLDFVLLNWGQNLGNGAVDQAELDAVLLNWGRQEGAARSAPPSRSVESPASSGAPQPQARAPSLADARSPKVRVARWSSGAADPQQHMVDNVFARNNDWLYG